MTNLLHCDHVFDVLTRGPFPSGHPDDASVEHHLRACHECRTLAEALRPAVGLIHEALSEEATLPAYRGSVGGAQNAEGVVEPSESALREGPWNEPFDEPRGGRPPSEPRRAESPTKALGSRGVVHFAVATALGVCVCLLWGQFQGPRSSDPVPNLTVEASSSLAPALRSLQTVLDLNLPPACFQRPSASNGEPLLAQAARDNRHRAVLHCCTQCHAAMQATTPDGSPIPLTAANLADLSQSCLACHGI